MRSDARGFVDAALHVVARSMPCDLQQDEAMFVRTFMWGYSANNWNTKRDVALRCAL